MSHKPAEEIRNYIANLEIPKADTSLANVYRADAKVFADDEQGAAVVDGSLVSFVSGLSGTAKNDVMNSTLLAQLAASKQYDRYKSVGEWYKVYINVLENVGWNMPSFTFKDYVRSSGTLVLSEATLEILRPICDDAEVRLVDRSLSGLRDKSGNEQALANFDRNAFPGDFGTFQIFPVSRDRINKKDVVMVLTAMQFTAKEHKSRFLWYTWTTTTVKLFQSANKATLNREVYGEVRNQVQDKLGDNAKKFIQDLEI